MGRDMCRVLAVLAGVLIVAGCQTTDPNVQILDNAEFVRVTELGQKPGSSTNVNTEAELPSVRIDGQPVRPTTQETSEQAATNAPAATNPQGKIISPSMVPNVSEEEDPALNKKNTPH